MRRDDELARQLKRWGYATVQRYNGAANDDGDRHMLDRARDIAPGTRERAQRQLIGRGGEARRRIMAQGMEGLSIVPEWACDPIRARNDAGPPRSGCGWVDIGVPDELRWIDRALSQLARATPVRAMVLQAEFCMVGSQRRKAEAVAERYGGAFTVWQYRAELERALAHLEGARAAA